MRTVRLTQETIVCSRAITPKEIPRNTNNKPIHLYGVARPIVPPLSIVAKYAPEEIFGNSAPYSVDKCRERGYVMEQEAVLASIEHVRSPHSDPGSRLLVQNILADTHEVQCGVP